MRSYNRKVSLPGAPDRLGRAAHWAAVLGCVLVSACEPPQNEPNGTPGDRGVVSTPAADRSAVVSLIVPSVSDRAVVTFEAHPVIEAALPGPGGRSPDRPGRWLVVVATATNRWTDTLRIFHADAACALRAQVAPVDAGAAFATWSGVQGCGGSIAQTRLPPGGTDTLAVLPLRTADIASRLGPGNRYRLTSELRVLGISRPRSFEVPPQLPETTVRFPPLTIRLPGGA